MELGSKKFKGITSPLHRVYEGWRGVGGEVLPSPKPQTIIPCSAFSC